MFCHDVLSIFLQNVKFEHICKSFVLMTELNNVKHRRNFMKKGLLSAVAVLFIAMGTSVLAQPCVQQGGCPLKSTVTEGFNSRLKPCPMKKQMKFNKAPIAAKRYQGYVHKIQRERATVYNALDLTDEQIKLREDILKENTPIYERKFAELTKESYKVKALKAAGASDKEINRQEKVVKNVKKDIEKLLNEENKLYKKSLTREQRSKYAMIKKLEEKDYKEASNEKDLYKSNPKMRPFGDPKKHFRPVNCQRPCPGQIPTPRPVLPPEEVK